MSSQVQVTEGSTELTAARAAATGSAGGVPGDRADVLFGPTPFTIAVGTPRIQYQAPPPTTSAAASAPPTSSPLEPPPPPPGAGVERPLSGGA